MPDMRYTLYDTAHFGVTANTSHVLFQVGEGADATHPEDETNARGSGQLPQEEAFRLDYIYTYSETELPEAELHTFWEGSLVEVKVADKTLLKVPLRLTAYTAAFGGHFTQAAAAARTAIGPESFGYRIDPPIEIPGGTRFQVRVLQRNAVAATRDLKLVLDGVLTMP